GGSIRKRRQYPHSRIRVPTSCLRRLSTTLTGGRPVSATTIAHGGLPRNCESSRRDMSTSSIVLPILRRFGGFATLALVGCSRGRGFSSSHTLRQPRSLALIA